MTTTASGPGSGDRVAIRVAERADLLQVVRVERASFVDAWPYQQFEAALGESGFLVAVAGQTVVGYVVADTIDDRGWPLGHIKDLAVHDDWRGRGIATRLLDRALSVLEHQGARRAKLEVRRSNDDAIALYRRFGFEAHHLISRYYEDGEAAAVFVLDLADRWRPFG